MPQRNIEGLYPYAYQGQEKDPETGMEAFELRLWDARLGRWLTTDPYGQFSSPYLGMGNNPISRIDPDGGFSPPTDFKNTQTGETVHVNDGINQVIEIDNSQWGEALRLSMVFDIGPTVSMFDSQSLQGLIDGGIPRPDLFFTINNVLEGQKFVGYNDYGNCFTCARQQEVNNGGNPSGPNDQINLLVDSNLNSSLSTNPALGIETITQNLLNGNSIVTGVNYSTSLVGNRNALTDHFVNIVSQGNDIHGNYFSFYDNATRSTGTNLNINRFYVNGSGAFQGRGVLSNYRATEIRPNN